MTVVKHLTGAQWDAIEAQYPSGARFVRCYNGAEEPGELRIILRLAGEQYDRRYVVRLNEETAELLLIEKP